MTNFDKIFKKYPRPWTYSNSFKRVEDANYTLEIECSSQIGNLIVHAVNSLQSIEEARAEGRKELGDKILVEMCKHEDQKYKPIIDLIEELTKGDG